MMINTDPHSRLPGSLTILAAAADADLKPLLRRALAQMRMASKRPITQREAERLADCAMLRAKQLHPDFDQCVRFLLILALRWFPNWRLTDLDQTLEMCLLVLKHASFTSEMREEAFGVGSTTGKTRGIR